LLEALWEEAELLDACDEDAPSFGSGELGSGVSPAGSLTGSRLDGVMVTVLDTILEGSAVFEQPDITNIHASIIAIFFIVVSFYYCCSLSSFFAQKYCFKFLFYVIRAL